MSINSFSDEQIVPVYVAPVVPVHNQNNFFNLVYQNEHQFVIIDDIYDFINSQSHQVPQNVMYNSESEYSDDDYDDDYDY